jgi:hypothetical protein
MREPLKIHISSQLMELLMRLLAIWLTQQNTLGKLLVIAIPLSRQKTATKWLVMLHCVKNFLLTYQPYVALRNFFRALLTTPHGLLLPVADRRPLVGHWGEL